MQGLPDSMTEGHQAGDSLALLGVVAAECEQLLAHPTGAAVLLLAHPVVGDHPPHLLTVGQGVGSGLAAASMLQILNAPYECFVHKKTRYTCEID